MKSILVLALIALFIQGLLAGPIGDGALAGSARGTKPEKAAPVENPPPKKHVMGAPNLEDKKRTEAASHEPKDEENSPETFQGDMKLTSEQLEEVQAAIDDQKTGRTKRKAKSNLSVRWPNSIVPYIITESSLGDSGVIRAAMDHWEEHTCLRFEPLTPSHSTQLGHDSYLSFFREDGQGCWSYVGRVFQGAQNVSIGYGCASLGVVVHEIGHAIGFHHEQSRPDRDNYIRVHYENIEPGFESQFDTYSSIDTHDVEYDTGSVMHYGAYGFTKNGLRTITTLNPLEMFRLGNRNGLSIADMELANLFYECDVDCASDIQCENNGYLVPSCACVCPSGFSGDRCEIVDETEECVFRLTDREGEIKSPKYPTIYNNNDNKCIFLIEGATGTTIELTFLDMDIESHGSCGYDAVEVRTDDVSLPGQKFCGSDLPPVQTSTGNQMLVAFSSDYSNVGRGFKASYVIVGDEGVEVVGTCGGNFDGSSGAMASPNYPDNYDNNLNCVYHIEVEAGRRVELSLLDFALEDQNSCGWDALVVDTGDGIKVPMKLCGSSFPARSLVSIDNQMVLTLTTDGSVTAGGFKASYRAVDL